MENKKKMAFNVVFLILVFAGTIYGVFHGEDLGEIARILKTVNLLWLIPGFICVIVFIWGESIIIYYMMRTLGIKRKKWTCFLFSSVGFFFSCITPSASGGQPAQIYYMKKQKIDIPTATIILMLVTIEYKFVLVFVGLAAVIFGQTLLQCLSPDVLFFLYLGIGLNVFCVVFMSLLVFKPGSAKFLIIKGFNLLKKLHLMKEKNNRAQRLEDSMEIYKEASVYLKANKKAILITTLISFVQRFFLFFITYVVYRSFGLLYLFLLICCLFRVVWESANICICGFLHRFLNQAPPLPLLCW